MDRICNEALLRKVTTPRAAAAHIKNGMTVGFSGFTVIGYPKVLPAELARRAEEGEELGITVITGGNVGDQLDGVLARSGVMKRRYGFQGNRDLRALANADRIQYVDTHVSHGPYLIKNGYLGKIDVAVIEVAAIRADGSLVLPFSVGIDDTLVKYADKLILEVNEAIPLEVEGMHDILTLERAPHTQAIEIFKPDDRVGSPYLPCDPDKVAAVILTNCEDTNQDLPAPTPDMEAIASHIVKFLQSEVAAGRLPNPLPPMQSGVGGVANAVLSALARSELDHLSVYTEVMQDAVPDLPVFRPSWKHRQNLLHSRGIRDHLVRDVVHLTCAPGNGSAGVYQAREAIRNGSTADLHGRYFNHLIAIAGNSRGFQVKQHIIRHIAIQVFPLCRSKHSKSPIFFLCTQYSLSRLFCQVRRFFGAVRKLPLSAQ